MSDLETLKFYSAGASDYAAFVGDGADNPWLTRFIEALPTGAPVLDFGCGHGWAAAVMTQAGLDVTAIDGSVGLAAEAKSRYGVDVTVATFDELDAVAAYDGVWVSFSLLHDSREALPGHIKNLRRAARPGARLYLGLKEGEGRHRDHLGRLYTYFSQAEIKDVLVAAGWDEIEIERRVEKGLAGTDDAGLHIMAMAI